MKLLKQITEDEMIAEFLSGELTSDRFGGPIRDELNRNHIPNVFVTQPNVTDASQNSIRRRLLSVTRGYEQRTGLFDGLPRDIKWHEATITKDELRHIKYTNYSYWVDLSSGTRMPQKAAKNILADRESFGVSNQPFTQAAVAVRKGHSFLPLILVGKNTEQLVALEGHLRLTAFSLAWDAVPETIKAIIGLSSNMPKWSLF